MLLHVDSYTGEKFIAEVEINIFDKGLITSIGSSTNKLSDRYRLLIELCSPDVVSLQVTSMHSTKNIITIVYNISQSGRVIKAITNSDILEQIFAPASEADKSSRLDIDYNVNLIFTEPIIHFELIKVISCPDGIGYKPILTASSISDYIIK